MSPRNEVEFEKSDEARIEDNTTMNDDNASLEKGDDVVEITWTPEEERSALRRLDWNLIPL